MERGEEKGTGEVKFHPCGRQRNILGFICYTYIGKSNYNYYFGNIYDKTGDKSNYKFTFEVETHLFACILAFIKNNGAGSADLVVKEEKR